MLTEDRLRRICVQIETGTLLLQDLPKTYQWVDILRTTVKNLDNAYRIMGVEFRPGAIFTGPEGNGRHSHAYALANNLKKSGGYKITIGIHGSDLEFDDSDELYSVLDCLEKIVMSSGNVVLILDQPELGEHSSRFQNQLLRLQQSLQRCQKSLFLIVITEAVENVISGLQSAFPRYHCPKPNAAAIGTFVDNMVKKPVPLQISKITKADILKAVKNCSWKQLSDLHTQLLRLLVIHYQLNYKTYKNQGYTEEQVYGEGRIKLPSEPVNAVLRSVADQNRRPATPAMQTVAATGDALYLQTNQTATDEADSGLVSGSTEDDDDAIAALIRESDDPFAAYLARSQSESTES